jgi:AcrR family transcriptional regulator
MPAAVKRTYHSPLRAEQARRTRERILEAAFALFAERGYAGTTIAAVAGRAGVSHETVYGTVGGKRRLLEDVIALAIAGDVEGTAVHEDALSAEIEELRDSADRLARMVDHSCAILDRTRPIHTVIRGAADRETFAADLSSRLLHERLAVQTERIRRHLAADLRPGLSVAEAGERYCALASPDLYFTLTAELGWTPEQHRRWLGELLARELLG